MNQYTISDIHGCTKTFKKLLEKIDLQKEDELFILGDMVDRGPDTKGTIEHILFLKREGYEIKCLMGNHERMMLDAYEQGRIEEHLWLQRGGTPTLKSYGIEHVEDVPLEHIEFISKLPTHFVLDDYVLVHAGLDFISNKDPFINQDAMLWIRRWHHEFDRDRVGGRKIIHGHTPSKKKDIIAFHKEIETIGILDIDGGCSFPHDIEYGYLCAYNLSKNELIFQANSEY